MPDINNQIENLVELNGRFQFEARQLDLENIINKGN